MRILASLLMAAGIATTAAAASASAVPVATPATAGAVHPDSSTYVSGTVQCLSMNVEGVWVAAQSGTSGWASWSATSNPTIANWHYTLSSGNSYSLHVGCGGSPQSWAVTTYSPVVSGSGHTFLCWDYAYEDPHYGTCTD